MRRIDQNPGVTIHSETDAFAGSEIGENYVKNPADKPAGFTVGKALQIWIHKRWRYITSDEGKMFDFWPKEVPKKKK